MPSWQRRIFGIHQFCLNQLIYALVLSTLFALAIWSGRFYLSHHRTAFKFLPWNLFLAWIPYLCSLTITILYPHLPRWRWVLIVPGCLWLLFLPNAPYIISDLTHLNERPPVPLWYDAGLLVAFAWTGCFLAVVSLSQMQHIVRERFGGLISWIFALSAIGLSGLGVYLGRFLRWNSWDVFLEPHSVLADIAIRVANPIGFRQAVGVSLVFSAFVLVCYVMFVSIENRKVRAKSMD